ncbi:MAG: glycosyltransferase family 4 protein [candidate division WOR-3 bacterium]
MLRLIFKLFSVHLTFCWFGTMSAFFLTFLSRLLHKPILIVIGGIDVASVPEIKYGTFVHPLRAIFSRFTLKHADGLLLVDPSLNEDIKKNIGFRLSNTHLLPTGYDYNFWRPQGKKEPIVLTVADCPDVTRVKLKGIDTFINSARYLPGVKFWVVGVSGEARKLISQSGLPANVTLFEPVAHQALLPFYQKAKVYCQLSWREGLPNALCEAMLCNCIPVGTRRGGIPSAIGPTGFYVEFGDPEDTARAIRKALGLPDCAGTKARQRIIENFPIEKRTREMASLIESFLKDEDHN